MWASKRGFTIFGTRQLSSFHHICISDTLWSLLGLRRGARAVSYDTWGGLRGTNGLFPRRGREEGGVGLIYAQIFLPSQDYEFPCSPLSSVFPPLFSFFPLTLIALVL